MAAKKIGTRFQRKQERKRYADEDIDDDEIEGKRLFSVEEKLASNKYNHKFAKQLKGHEVNLKWVQENGFSCPILVLDKTGLGMRVPSQNFTVNDVKQCVGSRRVLDIVDAMTQKGINMTMKEWAHYFENPESRDRTLNVISLEFSHTKLQNYVEQPTIARQMDWVDIAWPRHLKECQRETTNIIEKMKYPKVQKYALMSVAGCYTDFHIDMGGTSVWYHILHGQKVFWMIPPTDENLELYEKWTLSGKQGDVFFGDKVKKCQKITLEAGYTFFIPPGWIHAVFTPKDSLVFGGNFIHSFNVSKQLRMFEVENTTHVPQKFRYPFFVEIHWYVLERYVSQLTGKQHSVKIEPEAADIDDKTDVKSVCSKVSDSSSEQSRCRSHDEDWCSSPRSPIIDEHNYGCDSKTDIKQDESTELDSPKHADVSGSDLKVARASARSTKNDSHNNNGKTTKNVDPADLIKPVSVKLENCMAVSSKKPWTHLTKYELEGLTVIVEWLEGLPANKKRVPADIPDPDGLLRDAKLMLAAHASDDTQLAVTGEPSLKWPPHKEKLKKHRLMVPKKLKAGGTTSGVRRRRVRCKMCEPCTRQECGECNFCKDMKKFGGPGRLKQTCISRQCMAPVLAHSAVCYICNAADEVKQEDEDEFSPPTTLMECGICWEIVHPACIATKFPNIAHEGIVNEDLPSSWECPKCCNGGKQGQMKPRTTKGPQKHITEHRASTSGSDDSINVKVKENQPQSPPPDVTVKRDRKTPEHGHRRTRSNLTDTRNVLANADATTNGHTTGGDSATKGRRRAREDTVGKDVIPKKKMCAIEKSPLKKVAADRSSGTASPVLPSMSSPVSCLTSRGRETDSDKGTSRKRSFGASSSGRGCSQSRSVSPAPLDTFSDVEDAAKDEESDDRDTGGSREKEVVPLKQPRTLIQTYAIRPAPVSPPPKYVPMTTGAQHTLERAHWMRIFSALSPTDLARCMVVCKTWNRWCLDSRLWRVIDLSRRRITKQHLIGVVLRQPLHLDLGWTNVSRRQLSWLVSRLPRLAHLSLAGNCWQAITALCSSSCPLLVGLDLKWAQGVRDPCIKDLLSPPLDHRPGVDDSVSRLHRCEVLNLAGSDVTDASVALIVRFMPCIAYLDLSYCTRITDSGVDMLSEASSATCRSLVHINLTGCQQLTDNCLLFLSGVTQLRDLTLAGCPHITKRACLQFIENASGRRNLAMWEDRHIVSVQ